jgi:hypothetical protein
MGLKTDPPATKHSIFTTGNSHHCLFSSLVYDQIVKPHRMERSCYTGPAKDRIRSVLEKTNACPQQEISPWLLLFKFSSRPGEPKILGRNMGMQRKSGMRGNGEVLHNEP